MGTNECKLKTDAEVVLSTDESLHLTLSPANFYDKPKKIQIFYAKSNENYYLLDQKILSSSSDEIKFKIDLKKISGFQKVLRDKIQKNAFKYNIQIIGWDTKTEKRYPYNAEYHYKTQKIPFTLVPKEKSQPLENRCFVIYFFEDQLALYFDRNFLFETDHPDKIVCQLTIDKTYELGSFDKSEGDSKIFKLDSELKNALKNSPKSEWLLTYYGKWGVRNGLSRHQYISLTKRPNPLYDLDFSSQEVMLKQIKELKQEILSSKKVLNLLLYGPTSSGKSSLINTFWCLLHDTKNPTKTMIKCQQGSSTTKELQVIKLTENIKIFDFPGVESNDEFNQDEQRRSFWQKFNISDYDQTETLETGLKVSDLDQTVKKKTNKRRFNFVFFLCSLNSVKNLESAIEKFPLQITNITATKSPIQFLVLLTKLDEQFDKIKLNLPINPYETAYYRQLIADFRKKINHQNLIIGLRNYAAGRTTDHYEPHYQLMALYLLSIALKDSHHLE